MPVDASSPQPVGAGWGRQSVADENRRLRGSAAGPATGPVDGLLEAPGRRDDRTDGQRSRSSNGAASALPLTSQQDDRQHDALRRKSAGADDGLRSTSSAGYERSTSATPKLRRPRRPKGRRLHPILHGLVLTAIFLTLAANGYVVYLRVNLNRQFHRIVREPNTDALDDGSRTAPDTIDGTTPATVPIDGPLAPPADVPVFGGERAFNLLMVGIDERNEELCASADAVEAKTFGCGEVTQCRRDFTKSIQRIGKPTPVTNVTIDGDILLIDLLRLSVCSFQNQDCS